MHLWQQIELNRSSFHFFGHGVLLEPFAGFGNVVFAAASTGFLLDFVILGVCSFQKQSFGGLS